MENSNSDESQIENPIPGNKNHRFILLGLSFCILISVLSYLFFFGYKIIDSNTGIIKDIAAVQTNATTSSSSIDTSDWLTYKDLEYGFEFKYPPNAVINASTSRSIEFNVVDKNSKSNASSTLARLYINQRLRFLINSFSTSTLDVNQSLQRFGDKDLLRTKYGPRDELWKATILQGTMLGYFYEFTGWEWDGKDATSSAILNSFRLYESSVKNKPIVMVKQPQIIFQDRMVNEYMRTKDQSYLNKLTYATIQMPDGILCAMNGWFLPNDDKKIKDHYLYMADPGIYAKTHQIYESDLLNFFDNYSDKCESHTFTGFGNEYIFIPGQEKYIITITAEPFAVYDFNIGQLSYPSLFTASGYKAVIKFDRSSHGKSMATSSITAPPMRIYFNGDEQLQYDQYPYLNRNIPEGVN